MPIEEIIGEVRAKGLDPFLFPLAREMIPSSTELAALDAFEDVVMIGYPIGLLDSYNNLPVIRKGITATHPNNDYDGRKEFMVDMACFPGSSGSPVLLYSTGSYGAPGGGFVLGNRIRLLGILYSGPQFAANGDMEIVNVPTQQTVIPVTSIPCNLGICIKAERLLEFEPILRKSIGETE